MIRKPAPITTRLRLKLLPMTRHRQEKDTQTKNKQTQAGIMPEANTANNNQTNKHLYTQPPNYNNMNHQANHPQQPNKKGSTARWHRTC
jgi:hypothetical protein